MGKGKSLVLNTRRFSSVARFSKLSTPSLLIVLLVAFFTSLFTSLSVTHFSIPYSQFSPLVHDQSRFSEPESTFKLPPGIHNALNNEFYDIESLKTDLDTWLQYMRYAKKYGENDQHDAAENQVKTVRTACRELEARAQTCVFEGIACINVSRSAPLSRAQVIFVDDYQSDGTPVPSDKWCQNRHMSADPRYFSSRHWPFLTNTVSPQQSCLDAYYRKSTSLFTNSSLNAENNLPHAGLPSVNMSRIKWLPSISLVDLDYVEGSHNNHLLKDIIWLLDISLFQDSLAVQHPPTNNPSYNEGLHLFRKSKHIYLPQSRIQFEKQLSADINRLTYSLILQKDVRKLYPNVTNEDLHNSPSIKRTAISILDAFPELIKNGSSISHTNDNTSSDKGASPDSGELIFHQDIVLNQNETDLVCTPRIMVGAKIGNGAHERVCREIRSRAYDLYGIKRPPVVFKGQIRFPQPPKSILVLDRHITRKIENAKELVDALKNRFEPDGVNVSYITTSNISTAEGFVRVYSSAGVIITPHGSHNMGLLFMHRYRYGNIFYFLILQFIFAVFQTKSNQAILCVSHDEARWLR